MDIKADDMMDLLLHLNDALHQDYQWMGYDARLSKVTAKDIDCFKNKSEAEDFYKNELIADHSIVPVEPIWFIVQDLLVLQHGDELTPMDIRINVPQVIKNFEKQLLTTNVNALNEKNLEHLKDDLSHQGFGESREQGYHKSKSNVRHMDEEVIPGDKYWMVYNNSSHFINPNDIFFFDNKEAANEFAENNVSDRDHYAVISVYKEIADPDINGLNNTDGNAFTDAIIDHMEQQQLLINKNKVMNEKNLEYLKDNLRYQGFGESLQHPLEQNIREGKTEFSLQHKATYNNQAMENTLHFKKGDQNDMYFFNKYDAKLLQPEERSQTFYLDKGNGVTTKEAFNLLNGRAVHKELTSKEGEKYNAWVQLDLSKKEENGNYKLNRYHENYGYNLDKALQQYPIKEMQDPRAKEDLMKSMEKGNLQAVKMEIRGKEESYFIQADPQYKDINVFNKNQTKVDRDQVSSLKAEPAPGQSAKQEAKQMNNHKQAGGGDDDGPELKKKRTRKKGMAI